MTTKVNIAISQGLSAAKRIIPIVDIKNKIEKNEAREDIKIKDGTITFDNINFSYNSNPEKQVLKIRFRNPTSRTFLHF